MKPKSIWPQSTTRKQRALSECSYLHAQVQRDELATRPSFRETVEFLQAVVFVLCETLVEVKAVKR